MCTCVECLGIVNVYMGEVSRDCGCVHVWKCKGLFCGRFGIFLVEVP